MRFTAQLVGPWRNASEQKAVGANLEMNPCADNMVSHLEGPHSQTRRAFKSNLTGSLESRQMPRRCLNPASAPTEHEPFAYFKDVLEHMPTRPANRIDELLPHRWLPAS